MTIRWSDLVSGLTWAAGGALLGLALAHAFGDDRSMPLVALHALSPWIFPWAAPVLAVAAVRRRWRQAVPPAVVLLAWLWWVAPPLGRDPSAPGPTVRLVSSNVLMVNDDPSELVREVLEEQPDILIFQEFTPAVRDRMAATTWLTRLERPADHSYGLALYSRFPLVDHEFIDLHGVDWLRAVLDVHGQQVEVWNVHTLAPYKPSFHRGWLLQVPELARAAAEVERPLVLAGDLNLTPQHPAYDQLTEVLDDAYRRCGRAIAWTWPANDVHLTWVPPIRIDHVLVSAHWRCAAIREGVGAGSDHRPVIADLVVAR